MRLPARRALAAALALTAALALAACKDNTTKDNAKPSEKTSSSHSSPSKSPSAASTEVPKTTTAAVDRYEEHLHAMGNKKTKKMCEIAKPAMDTVSGDCEANFNMMLSMFSTEQLEALKTATIDKSAVTSDNAGRVDIPTSAVRSDATFTESDLGGVTMEYQKDNWYIID